MTLYALSVIRAAELALAAHPDEPMAEQWYAQLEAVEGAYQTIARHLRRHPWYCLGRGSRRPIPTFDHYLASNYKDGGLATFVAYVSSFNAVWRYVGRRRDTETLVEQVLHLHKLSEYVLAPRYRAFVGRMQHAISIMRSWPEPKSGDMRALADLSELIQEGFGFAADSPSWTDRETSEVYLEPGHVAHRLVDQIDRLIAFFADVAPDRGATVRSSERAQQSKTVTSSSEPLIDSSALRYLGDAKALIENGILGILKEYWGIEIMPVHVGDVVNNDTMLCVGVSQVSPDSADGRLRIAQILKPGFTYNGGRVYRMAQVIVYDVPRKLDSR